MNSSTVGAVRIAADGMSGVGSLLILALYASAPSLRVEPYNLVAYMALCDAAYAVSDAAVGPVVQTQ